MKTIYTKSALVSATVKKRRKLQGEYRPRWKPVKKFLGMVIRSEGWYYPLGGSQTEEQILKSSEDIEIDQDTKEIWLKPQLKLEFSNGETVYWIYDKFRYAEEARELIMKLDINDVIRQDIR